MRKAELDRLLLTAVAEAIGQPVPAAAKATRKPRRQSSRAQAIKHLPVHFTGLRHEPHSHIGA